MSGATFDERDLVCPACRARLGLAARRDAVVCSGCGRVYPIREGVPILLIEEATLPSGLGTAKK